MNDDQREKGADCEEFHDSSTPRFPRTTTLTKYPK